MYIGMMVKFHRPKEIIYLAKKAQRFGLQGYPAVEKAPLQSLEQELFKRGKLSYRLDGDNIRLGINKNLGFSAEDRTENIRRIGEIAKLFVDCGVLSLSSFISPYREDRDTVRALHDSSHMTFIEVFVDCSLDVAESRDPKGLYKKARAGEIKNFTGIDDPYEEPTDPEIHLNSDQMSLEEEVSLIIAYLENHNLLKSL